MVEKRFNGGRAKQLMIERGRLKNWFANQLGLKPESFNVYLNGGSKPGRKKVQRLAELLEVPVSELYQEIVVLPARSDPGVSAVTGTG